MTSRAHDLKDYFERAQSINLLLAHDSVFQQFVPRQGQLPAPHAGVAAVQAGEALAYLETLYPGRISEACLIDSTGTELGRVVQGIIVPASQMSHNEANNAFFAPTLRLPSGRVYQAAPYMSSDTNEWVISNSTPMVNSLGRPWGMVHFELPLDSFRPAAKAGDNQRFSDLIVDNRTGQVLLDSRRPLVDAASLGRAGSAELRALVARPDAVASATVDGRRVAVARVPVGRDNANSWSVVVAMPTEPLGWSSSIGFASVATALAAAAAAGVRWLLASHPPRRAAGRGPLQNAYRPILRPGVGGRPSRSCRLPQPIRRAAFGVPRQGPPRWRQRAS